MKNQRVFIYSVLLLFVFIFSFTLVGAAPDLTILPSQDSHTPINNEYCGSQKPIQFTITNNNQYAGTLCWSYTNRNPSPQKLTSSCIEAGKTAHPYPYVYVPVPISGSETVSVQLECYDFLGFFQDKCIDSYSYEQAIANKASCSGASGKNGCDGVISPRYFDVSCEALQFSINPSKLTLNLLSGQSETITITVTNQMTTQSLFCDNNLGTITSSGSSSYQMIITAPSGTGSITKTATVSCNANGVSTSKSANVLINYQSDPCISTLNDAQITITDAQTQITNANAKIKEASEIGADITSSQASLTDAQSSLSTAQTQFSTAKNSCNGGDKTNGVTQASNAKSAALQAKTSATNSLNIAQQAITTYTQKKTEAKNKISDANSLINISSSIVDKAEKSLKNATELNSFLPSATSGLDLVSHKAKIETAKAKLDQAKSYIKEAGTAFDLRNFDSAQSKASSASQLASDSNSIATDSYTSINTVLMTLGEGARTILSASSEVSNADDALTKMNSIIRYLEKKGVVLQEAKDITENGQQNIDSAKDLLSQAKNRLDAGVSSEAAQKAISARDKAAEPINRLQRISTSISTKIEDTIEDNLKKSESDITTTDIVIKAATETYGADSNYVIDANNKLNEAKDLLTQAKRAFENIKSSTDLTTILTQGDIAFKTLDEITKKSQLANSDITAAKTMRIVKVGGVAAAILGVLGGGFLYYRRKKKHKHFSRATEEIERLEKELLHLRKSV